MVSEDTSLQDFIQSNRDGSALIAMLGNLRCLGFQVTSIIDRARTHDSHVNVSMAATSSNIDARTGRCHRSDRDEQILPMQEKNALSNGHFLALALKTLSVYI